MSVPNCCFGFPLPPPVAVQHRCNVTPWLICTKSLQRNRATHTILQRAGGGGAVSVNQKYLKEEVAVLVVPTAEVRKMWSGAEAACQVRSSQLTASCLLLLSVTRRSGRSGQPVNTTRQRSARPAQLCGVFRGLTVSALDSFVLFHRVCWRFGTSPRRSACCAKQMLRNSPPT